MSEVFLEVLNIGIMASWLVLAVVLARMLLKKAPAWVKCGLWAIVALRLVWPFEINSLLSLIPSAQTLPPQELYHYTPEVHTGISVLNSAINPTFTQVFKSDMGNSVNPLQVAVIIASVVWIVGMLAMVIYAAVSFLRLRRRVRISMPVGQGVYLCDSVNSPFILGIFRPRIYLPSELPEEKRESILAHERAHLARRDHWWKPLGFALLTVFWFHPLLWLAYILLCRDVELACDEKVIGTLSDNEKKTYSEVLLECTMPKKWISACPLAFGETGVKQRIKAVLHYKKPALWIIIAALILGSVLAFCFLTEPVIYRQISDSRPLGLMVREIEEDHFFGTDTQGNVWVVEHPAEAHWKGQVVWVVAQDKVQVLQEPTETSPGKYKVKPESVWSHKEVAVDVTHTVFDAGKFDIDNDGIVETCVMSFGPTSGMFTIELSVWRGEHRETSVIFYSSTSMASAAFYAEDGTLKILKPDRHYREENWHMHIYDVSYENGKLIVSEDREPLDVLSQNDVSGNSYIYEESEEPFRDFIIHFHEDNTFTYYEGVLSSHIGHGNWKMTDGKLLLQEKGGNGWEKNFVFSVEANTLVYLAEESDPFTYIDVADGDWFRFYGKTET